MHISTVFLVVSFFMTALGLNNLPKHDIDNKYAIKANDETYYQLDYVVNELGHDMDINGDAVLLNVRNIVIELKPYSNEIIIKTPPYGTYLEEDGTFGEELLAYNLTTHSDNREIMLEGYSQLDDYEEQKSEFRNILLEDVNVIELENVVLLKSNDDFYVSLEFLDEIFETKQKSNSIQLIDYYVDYIVIPSDTYGYTFDLKMQMPKNDLIKPVYRDNNAWEVDEEDWDFSKEYRNKKFEKKSVTWIPVDIVIIGYTRNGYIIGGGYHNTYLIDNTDVTNINYYQYDDRYRGARID